jgi:hypothetical protein
MGIKLRHPDGSGRVDDYASVSHFYFHLPSSNLPGLPPVKDRIDRH